MNTEEEGGGGGLADRVEGQMRSPNGHSEDLGSWKGHSVRVYAHSLGGSGSLDCDLEPLDFGAIFTVKSAGLSVGKALLTDADVSLA